MEMFFKFDPTNIIKRNYLQQLEKYVTSQLDIHTGWNQSNISEEEQRVYTEQYLDSINATHND